MRPPIVLYEYDTLKVGDNLEFTPNDLASLQNFHSKNSSFYSLVNHGVKFNQFVGVLRVGNLTIEILPKADRGNSELSNNSKESLWRSLLIGMLKSVGTFDVQSSENSQLKLRSNHILDLYFELFISEVESLLHKGLVRKYRKTEGNQKALKGSLHFAKHLQQNVVHKERFYVRYTTYDKEHTLHKILYKTILLIHSLNTNPVLKSRESSLLLNFQEMPDIAVSEALFDRIKLDRKTLHYANALQIAKLLLLNYHPDLSRGRNDVLALLFDMNKLWEKFVFVTIRNKIEGFIVKEQVPKKFWQGENQTPKKIKPDIVIWKEKESDSEKSFVIDTKWKIVDDKPSDDDLKQMYVYAKFFRSEKVFLFYPGSESIKHNGNFFHEFDKSPNIDCSLIKVSVQKNENTSSNIGKFQEEIMHSIKKNILESSGI